MRIGDFRIGSAPYIIAEAGINHNGDFGCALQMIYIAKSAGADAVKFQTFRADEFCKPADPLYSIFKRCELSEWAWSLLKAECDRVRIEFLSTPQNRSDLDLLLPLGIQAIKVGSDDFCNLPLIADYASTGLPLILSTGMADADDILLTMENVDLAQTALMVCTSQYPTSPHEANVSRIIEAGSWDIEVGFSDHTVGNTAAAMAVAYGAVIFEKHFTLDKTMAGPDHSWSCDPTELKAWVDTIRDAWVMRGHGRFELSECEAEQKRRYQRRAGQQFRGE